MANIRIRSRDGLESVQIPNPPSATAISDLKTYIESQLRVPLAFAVKRAGFMYGRVVDGGRVEVDFIYEPPQQGTEEQVLMFRDSDEEALVEAVALGLDMRRVGFIFNQTVGQDKGDYTMSHVEVLLAAEMHAQSGLKEWVTAAVKLEVNEDGGDDVHFEAFQMSDMCVRLFKEVWLLLWTAGCIW